MHWSLFSSEPSQQRPALRGPPLSKTAEIIMRLENLSEPRFLAEMVEGYLTTSLWTSTDEDGESLCSDYDLDDLDDATRLRMQADCACFLADVWEELSHVYMEAGRVGHAFWLTRNRHGAGFWDRDLGVFGERLTKKAQAHGSYELYVADAEEGEEYGKVCGCDG